jgi:nucleotidyltransferase substrate binding protein (TIGR01987 family)
LDDAAKQGGRVKDDKLKKSVKNLEHALSFGKKAGEDEFYFAGIAKSFESCLEYAWKYFKRRAEEEGFEAYSPKESIKYAGRMGLIDDVESWLDFLEDRNDAVHNYAGISNADYLKTIKAFFLAVKKIK